MRPVEVKITKTLLKEEYIKKNKTMQEIATSIGCGLVTVMRNLERVGIQRRPASITQKGKLNNQYIKNDVECPVCKTIFHVKPFRTKRAKHNFCSKICKHEWMKTQIGENAISFKDGRTLKKYFCIDCGKEVGLHSGFYGEGRCDTCRAIQNGKDLSGKNHPMWQGGITFEPYTSDWTKALREAVRNRDGHICQNPDCGCTEEENGQALEVHHIDYDKEHSVMENLISLCIQCHRKTNANRKYWTEYFSALMLSRSSL